MTNDYIYTEEIKEKVENYLRQIPKIDDAFFEKFFGKKAQAKFISGTIEDQSIEDAMIMNGLAGIDCRQVDFSQLSLKNYTKIPFDSKTQFPDNIQKVFDAILEKSKSFGFGLEELLDEEKLSGTGINIAVVDEDIDISQIDTKDMNIVHHGETLGHHYHGQTVTSLIASNSCGVAKGAKVHFFGATSKKRAEQFKRIIEYNNECSDDSEKISVLSGSWRLKENDFLSWQSELRKAGCELVCQNNFITSFTEISGDDVILDMTEEEKSELSENMRGMIDKIDIESLVKIPINRTYHQYGREKDVFKYQASYSNSWGIPQVAGLFALYRGKDKNLTFERFCDICTKTASKNKVINPSGIYEEIEMGLKKNCKTLETEIER